MPRHVLCGGVQARNKGLCLVEVLVLKGSDNCDELFLEPMKINEEPVGVERFALDHGGNVPVVTMERLNHASHSDGVSGGEVGVDLELMHEEWYGLVLPHPRGGRRS